VSATTKVKRALALALAGGSLAVGVPAALAASGGGDDADQAPTSTLIQEEQDQARPDRDDCPERDGAQGDEGQGGSAEQGGSTPAPPV